MIVEIVFTILIVFGIYAMVDERNDHIKDQEKRYRATADLAYLFLIVIILAIVYGFVLAPLYTAIVLGSIGIVALCWWIIDDCIEKNWKYIDKE